MRRFSTIIFMLLWNNTFSQSVDEVNANSEINKITVYLKNARITRTAKTTLKSGKSIVKIGDLSPHIDEGSIQVKGIGDFTILSVKKTSNHLVELQKDKVLDSLDGEVETIENLISKEDNRLNVLSEKRSLLDKNKLLARNDQGVSLAQLSQALNFYDEQLTKINNEERMLISSIAKKKEQREKLGKQISVVLNKSDRPISEIWVELESKINTRATLIIDYLVGQAGWFPKYDIRVNSIEEPVNLSYKAEVYQNTGIDWKDVKIRFSNANPSQSGLMPELSKWELNYPRYTNYQDKTDPNVRQVYGRITSVEDGSALPGVNVVVKGTTIGTVTDLQGYYKLILPNNAKTLVFSFIGLSTEERSISSENMSLQMSPDVTQLSEVVVSAFNHARSSRNVTYANQRVEAKKIATAIIENQTTVDFEINDPYSIKSNNEKRIVDLKQYSIDALYEYRAIPKREREVFLTAKILNWSQYSFLEGEANLYLEDTYVGKTILEAKSIKDTLDISLGRDKNIVIARNKTEEFSNSQTIGYNKIETRGFDIFIKNNKSQSVNITVVDQIPISINNEISVSLEDKTGAYLDEKTGELKWNLNLKSNESKKIKFVYSVKYPKRENIVLE